MTIMPEAQGIDNTIAKRFTIFFKRFKVKGLLRGVNATKAKGVPAYSIFTFLLGLVFTRKNLYTLLKSAKSQVSFGKDAAYRFLNRSSIHWEAFVRRLSHAVIGEVAKLDSKERKSAYVLDDSPYYRDRSKKIELLSRCYDHSENRYYKGLNLLNLAWTDGATLVPVDFRLLASGEDKNLLEGSHVKDDKRTLATKRRKDARTDKPTIALQMLKAAKNAAAQAKYVLFDSWFCSPKFVLSVEILGYDIVARLKNHENYRYLHNGQLLSISQIYQSNEKRRGMSRYLLAATVQIQHQDFDGLVPAKIVYVRDKSNRKKWVALISTDVSLTEDEIVALYGKRWDIETFHKMIKSYLRLAKEFQMRSFDAMVAHTAVVLTRYIFLTLESRENKDERSWGEMFYTVCAELEDISFQYAFGLIIDTLKLCLRDYLLLAAGRMNGLVQQFLAALPLYIKDKLNVSVCES